MNNKRIVSELVKIAKAIHGSANYYHVTFTKNVNKIKKKGLLTFQTTNWVKGTGDRYGEGQVFVFENEKDAIRWAAKMDWSFNQTMGSGKVSIVLIGDVIDWEEDASDPIGHLGSHGKWFKRYKRVDPKDVISAYPVTIEKIKSIQD